MVIRARYRVEFDRDGTESVRAKLAKGSYGDDMRTAAREWLQEQDNIQGRALSALSASAQDRAATAADRAATAAERQATSAERATRIATAALIIAIISGIFSIISLFRSGP